ncbi:hypothetical protein ACHQM5_010635 [Ranunculus cassubicifolius]
MATVLKQAAGLPTVHVINLSNGSPFCRSLDGEDFSDDEYRRFCLDGGHFGRPTGFFADVRAPLSQIKNLDQMKNQSSTSRGGNIFGKGWTKKTDDEAVVVIKENMPGLGKEDVKVSVEDDMLVIKGEAPKEADDDEEPIKYMSKMKISSEKIKVDEIKATMKNGVLKVILPKVKKEESKNVFQVNVD